MKTVKKHNIKDKIFIHLPAYRDPELVPTIKDCLAQAKYPERIVFGICRQYNEADKFDNLDEFRGNKQFKLIEMVYTQAKGLPYARKLINELITDETYILQLDSHHRFVKDWDDTLQQMHLGLEEKGFKPILTGYLPYYTPKTDPIGRAMEPWQQQFVCFYPHGTIFIRPALLVGWQQRTEPVPSRFISGHFAFARAKWTKDVVHDPNIYFSGDEINLTVRSYTHGYDLFHPHKLVIWHSTMREERGGILKWDDDSKNGVKWGEMQDSSRKRIRTLFKVESDSDINLTGYQLGTTRTLADYEAYAGVNFKDKTVQKYTLENGFPPTPVDSPWSKSFYHLVNVYNTELPAKDYKSILIAFDDENGIGIHSKSIEGQELQNFLKEGRPIHYEEYFQYFDKKPVKMVAWGYSETRGWAERVEKKIL